jgi:hypothetical protein
LTALTAVEETRLEAHLFLLKGEARRDVFGLNRHNGQAGQWMRFSTVRASRFERDETLEGMVPISAGMQEASIEGGTGASSASCPGQVPATRLRTSLHRRVSFLQRVNAYFLVGTSIWDLQSGVKSHQCQHTFYHIVFPVGRSEPSLAGFRLAILEIIALLLCGV